MRPTPTVLTLGALLAAGAQAQTILTVRVYNYAALSDNILSKAEATAQRVFRRAGIETEWIQCPKERDEEERYPGCRKPAGAAGVILLVTPRLVEGVNLGPQVFGLALSTGDNRPSTQAYVFYQRIEQAATESHRGSLRITPEVLLAYVIVHEIGHLLLGPDRHSSRGIMRPRWQPEDLREMEIGRLIFPSAEAKRLQARLAERATAQEP